MTRLFLLSTIVFPLPILSNYLMYLSCYCGVYEPTPYNRNRPQVQIYKQFLCLGVHIILDWDNRKISGVTFFSESFLHWLENAYSPSLLGADFPVNFMCNKHILIVSLQLSKSKASSFRAQKWLSPVWQKCLSSISFVWSKSWLIHWQNEMFLKSWNIHWNWRKSLCAWGNFCILICICFLCSILLTYLHQWSNSLT